MSNTIKNNIYAVYVFTAVIASILINVLLKLDIELDYMSIDIYSIAAISNEKSITIFGYILLKRLKQLFIIYLLAKVINPSILQHGIIIALIFLLGAYMSVQTYYFGFMGIVIFLACIFPQYIIYVFLIKYLCKNISKESINKIKSIYYINITLLLLLGVVFEEIFLIFFWGELQQYIVLQI